MLCLLLLLFCSNFILHSIFFFFHFTYILYIVCVCVSLWFCSFFFYNFHTFVHIFSYVCSLPNSNLESYSLISTYKKKRKLCHSRYFAFLKIFMILNAHYSPKQKKQEEDTNEQK